MYKIRIVISNTFCYGLFKSQSQYCLRPVCDHFSPIGDLFEIKAIVADLLATILVADFFATILVADFLATILVADLLATILVTRRFVVQ